MNVILSAFGTAYAALAVWFLIRIINGRESWLMAVVILIIAAGVGAALTYGLAFVVTGC